MKKLRSETKTDMDRAAADKNVIGENGARRKALLAFVKPLTCLAAAAIFVIRVVMDYLIHYDKSLMPNARQVEYALIFFWAVGLAVCAVLKMSMGGGTVLSRLGGLLKRKLCVEHGILLGILIWGIVSCISMETAYKGDWVAANQYAMEDMAVSILVFFPMAFFFEGKELENVLQSCLRLMMTVITALMIVVIWNVFHSNVIQLPDGPVLMNKGKHLVINSNRNTVAAYASFTAFLCPVMMLWASRKWEKALYVLAFIVHWVIQCLTQSTTGLAVGALAGGLMLVLYLMERGGKGSFRHRLLITSLCGAAVMLLLWMSRIWIFRLYQVCTGASPDTMKDMSNNYTFLDRVRIWKAAVRAIFGNNGTQSTFRNAMFGYTFAGVPPVINTLCDRDMYTHNQYLEVGASMGIPALLAYIAFSVLMAIRCVRIALADRGRVTLMERFIPVLILSLVVGNLPEAMLMGYGFMTGCFFFLMCGWCSRRSRDLGNPSLPWKASAALENTETTDPQEGVQASVSVDT